MLNESNIHDFGVQGPSFVPEAPATTDKAAKPKGDSGLSTIETSEAMAALFIPSQNAPLLMPPPDTSGSSSVGAVGGGGLAIALLLAQGENQVKQEVLDGWAKSVREQGKLAHEEALKIVNSPAYQDLIAIKTQGNPHQGNVSGVQGATSANASQALPIPTNYNILTAIASSEKLSSSKTTSINDSSQVAKIPEMGIMLAGGVAALGVVEVSGLSNTPMVGTQEIVEKLAPIAQLAPADLIPMINLMVMAPIYFNSLEEAAVSRMPAKEGENYVKTAQNFAKDMISKITNPDFVLAGVSMLYGSEKMSPEKEKQAGAMVKLILATVALSLLYTTEVGKAQAGEYWGMEAKDLQGLLNGTITMPDPDAKDLTQQQKLTMKLIKSVKEQLEVMPPDMSTQTMSALLDYVGGKHSMDSMLDPYKAFAAVADSMNFDAEKAKTLDKRA